VYGNGMLKQIQVSGFKSLEDFRLHFGRGLNVVIGPNGSGKTNIINFIEFLSYLSQDSLLDAVSRSGGAGRIFRRDVDGTITKQISFRVSGEGEYTDWSTDGNKRVRQWAAYELSAVIELSENNSSIYYRAQRLKFSLEKSVSLTEWEFDVETVTHSEGRAITRFPKFAVDKLQRVFYPRPKDLGQIRSQIEQLLSEHANSRSLQQVLGAFMRVPGIIDADLWGAKSFNISPSIVRMPEDIASEPGIAPDGSGLAATLFAVENAKRMEQFEFYRPFPGRIFAEPEKIMKQIISYSKIVNDSIQTIEVRPDTVEAKLRIFLGVDYEGGTLSLPFGLVSDGTAKWFTLVTAIATSSSVFVLEEPENYLHPLMQMEIVRILKDAITQEGRELFAIMTTHSETILNCIDPEEMILVHMQNGRTVAKRPSNAEDIRAEIKSTGFGAGYYYITGAIE
jgi:predicted ATPase